MRPPRRADAIHASMPSHARHRSSSSQLCSQWRSSEPRDVVLEEGRSHVSVFGVLGVVIRPAVVAFGGVEALVLALDFERFGPVRIVE